MLAFLLVTGLVIAFVLGSALAMRPSPRQRRIARLRERAFGEGLRVQLRPGEAEVDYLLSWRSVDAASAAQLRVEADRADGEAWQFTTQGVASSALVRDALASFPACVRRVAVHAEGLAARWEEGGSEDDVAALAQGLRALREACASRA